MVTTSSDGIGQPAGTAAKSFKGSFWNCDIGNFTGFEVLVKRVKDGRAVCKEYTEFLRQRSLIEEQYGKALVKLAKSATGREEISLVRPAWDSVKTHTEMVGLNHIQASNQLVAEVGRMMELMDTGRERRKWAEETVRTLQCQVKAAHKRSQESRKSYEMRCRDEIQASHQFHQEVARTGQESGGAERAQGRHTKARQAMEAAEESNRAAVENLEDAQAGWQRETENCADTFQEMETTRLSLLRDSAWRVTNIGSSCCVSDDEVYEETRKVLEGCDLEEGLQQFIQQHETGGEPPSVVSWEPLPNSGSLGMGHLGQGRGGGARRPAEWDTYSLGRPEVTQQSLAEAGRSRSDLGYSLSQSQASLHRQSQVRQTPVDPASLPPVRPKKPPRLLQYTPTQQQQQQQQQQQPQQITSTQQQQYASSQVPPGPDKHRTSVAPTSATFPSQQQQQQHQQQQQQYTSPPLSSPRSVSITSVENSEYYTLPEQMASSDYNSDQSTDYSPDSSSPPHRQSPPSKSSYESTHSLRRPPAYPQSPGQAQYPGPTRRRAVVLCEYRRKSVSEVSLGKNSVVTVVEGSPSAEWWRVETDQGVQGFYPASFLRQMG